TARTALMGARIEPRVRRTVDLVVRPLLPDPPHHGLDSHIRYRFAELLRSGAGHDVQRFTRCIARALRCSLVRRFPQACMEGRLREKLNGTALSHALTAASGSPAPVAPPGAQAALEPGRQDALNLAAGSVPLKRDDFSSNRPHALAHCWSNDLFRKPVSTFRDHALAPRTVVHAHERPWIGYESDTPPALRATSPPPFDRRHGHGSVGHPLRHSRRVDRLRVRHRYGDIHEHVVRRLPQRADEAEARVADRVRDRAPGGFGGVAAVNIDTHAHLGDTANAW